MLPEAAQGRVTSTLRSPRVARWVRPRLWPLRRTPRDARGGASRGTPLHRYYADRFVAAHAADVRGHLLVFRDDDVVHKYGHDLASIDILDTDPDNDVATVLADVGDADSLPAGAYDCLVLPDVLRFVPDLEVALRNAWKSLRQGGVLLLTVPVLSAVLRGSEPDRWRLPPAGLELVLKRACPAADITVVPLGNFVTSVATLDGLAVEDLSRIDLDRADDQFPTVVGARLSKATT